MQSAHTSYWRFHITKNQFILIDLKCTKLWSSTWDLLCNIAKTLVLLTYKVQANIKVSSSTHMEIKVTGLKSCSVMAEMINEACKTVLIGRCQHVQFDNLMSSRARTLLSQSAAPTKTSCLDSGRGDGACVLLFVEHSAFNFSPMAPTHLLVSLICWLLSCPNSHKHVWPEKDSG